ncbi:MAG TPA: hypothetical protein VGJ05_18160 [Fimbriiglobus sp.]
MEYFTARNTVILALVQEGVITLGVLGAGASIKMYRDASSLMQLPQITTLLCDYGWLLLGMPLIWTVYAFRELRREDASTSRRVLAVTSGILFLLGLMILVWYASIGRMLMFIVRGDSF